ncbi:zinc finger BED domain-containing protein RICESLEEPER 2-like [Chenopodium quinoa]|uniref:zinc finger BED domain-containing protein RICESLEEPER 2-like n=1 Tax=Chenopodium quinoa TaxID=63459 RepID=UPI000B7902FB|nr:zinc finger BED domain-containing protein RICESLEEPER 2-like [Chenopodium quinoa]
MVVNLGMSYRSQMGCLNLVNGIVLPLFFLKIFYDATLRVSGSLYITSNVYLQELVGISVLIKKKVMSNDVRVSLMASGMKKKHDKYWENVDNVNLLLYIAVILDPRRKMGYTKWAINQLYDSEKAKYLCDKVMQTLNDMYELYVFENPPNESIPPKTSDFPEEVEDMDSDVDVAELEFEKEVGSCVGVQGKNELAKYLEDDREVNPAGKSFDCLGWWKKYGERYPTIALMARDVLVIPMSTVASESAFSTGGRVLDSFRSSLSTKMVEALICAQDWLRLN